MMKSLHIAKKDEAFKEIKEERKNQYLLIEENSEHAEKSIEEYRQKRHKML
jgi:Pyruvate/2-oxoacid:ferredoxin oxidoreductase gamma subunit